MEMMKTKLFEAARKGCVGSLKQLCIDDPLVLKYVTTNTETVLHVAAKLGHTEFVKKVISMEPRLAKELNSKGSSPLHLASKEGHIAVVRALLLVDKEMCLVRDIHEQTPIHVAIVKGRDEVVKAFLEESPDATRVNLTILHLCVIHNRLKALKLIVETISNDTPDFINSKDHHGDTVLHLAIAYKRVEIIKFLLTLAGPILDVNALNNHGKTALKKMSSWDKSRDNDVQEYLEIRELLTRVGAIESPNLLTHPIFLIPCLLALTLLALAYLMILLPN